MDHSLHGSAERL